VMVRILLNFLIAGTCCFANVTFAMITPLYADIFVRVDSEGVLHFTNVPTSSTSSEYKVYIKETPQKPFNSYNEDLYDDAISEASKRHGVSFSLLKALIKTESDFDPRAVSKAGAMGLMQIMPENFRRLNIKDPFDPKENIMGGARYLKELIQRFEGELQLAIAAYNAGPKAVEQYNRIPPYQETENFVKAVMRYYSIFDKS